MSTATSVSAGFALNSYLLSVNKTGSGSGTVTSDTDGIDCGATCSVDFDFNTVVTLTANPAAGSTFTGWSGSGCSGIGTCVVTMSASRIRLGRLRFELLPVEYRQDRQRQWHSH